MYLQDQTRQHEFTRYRYSKSDFDSSDETIGYILLHPKKRKVTPMLITRMIFGLKWRVMMIMVYLVEFLLQISFAKFFEMFISVYIISYLQTHNGNYNTQKNHNLPHQFGKTGKTFNMRKCLLFLV